MSVRQEGDVIFLEGTCRVEEAETLAALLDGGEVREIDLSRCEHLHAALAQVMLVFRPNIRNAPPEGVFNRDFLFPALAFALGDR